MHTLLSACVFLMMLCVGLDFSWQQWQSLLRSPRPIFVGMLAQYIVIPAVAMIVAGWFRDTPEIALAIILIVASPGGPIANAMVHYAGARIDLSLSLTAINGLLCVFTSPLIADLGFLLVSGKESGLHLPLMPTISHLLLIILMPIVIGGALGHFTHEFSRHLRTFARYGTVILLTIALFILFVANLERIHLNFLQGMLAVSTLCFMMLAAGSLVAKFGALNEEFSFAIANEVSVHNVPLALLMAESILHRPELSGLIVLYVPVIFLMTFTNALLYRRRRAT